MENRIQSKKIIVLLIAVLLLGGLTLLLEVLPERRITRQKASGATPVTVFLEPAVRQVTAGETYEVQVALKSTAQVSTNVAGTEITYDPSKVTITDLRCLSPYSATDFTTIASNRLIITCHAPPPTQPVLNPGQTYPFGSFKVTIKSGVAGSVALGIDRSLTLIPEVTNETYLDMTGTVIGAEYAIAGDVNGPVIFYLDPGNGTTINKGGGSTITVKMTSERPVGIGVGDLRIAYDPNVLDISNITCGEIFSVTGQAQTIGGMVYLACGRQGGIEDYQITTTPVVFGRFTVTPKNTAVVGNTTNLVFNQTIAAGGSLGTDYGGTGGTVSYTIGQQGGLTCTDGTAYNACSATKPKYCNASGQLIDSCGAPNNCGCTTGTCQANGTCILAPTATPTPTPMRCSDQTLYGSCSTTKPKFCNNGSLINACSICDCPDGQVCQANGSCTTPVAPTATPTPPRCSDGTLYGDCSNTKPKQCLNGELVNRCLPCDCPVGLVCQANGSCLAAPTVTPTATLTPTPTSTPVPGTAYLAFSISSQGIVGVQRADQKVIVKVKKAGFEKTFTNINLVSGTTGIYSGQVTLDGVTPGSGYAVFVKGPRHLAKKLCEDNQAKDKRCGEAGAITLNAGVNTYNWSLVQMDGGDLPLSTIGQDGVVNSLDYNFMNGKLGSSATADLVIADINLDGIVNASDRVLLRNTLETKYEEDY